MKTPKTKKAFKRQRGFTIIETLVTVALLSIMLVGFRYTIKAYLEQINRSWSERFLEQYGNSIVEYVARNIVNAKDITIAANQGNYGTFFVIHEDPFTGNYSVTYSSTRDDGIKENNEKIFEEYPPGEGSSHVASVIGPRESFELTEFRGEYIYRPEPPYFNPTNFLGRVFRITLKLKYIRETDFGSRDYEREMTFTSQVSLKNRSNSPAQGT